jgi:hypothetical protein
MTVPSSALKIGRTYRARVRMKDTTGRWSHWSAPVEFVAGEPTAPFPQQTSLRVTEIHYHPAADLDQEFVEVANIGTQPVDLTPVAFTAGIEFRFADGAIPSLAPGERAVVVHNLIAFRARYGASIPVAGEFKDRLSNAGELLELTYGGSVTIQEITFEDEWYPLSDGGGRSLEAVDVAADPATWSRPRPGPRARWTAALRAPRAEGLRREAGACPATRTGAASSSWGTRSPPLAALRGRRRLALRRRVGRRGR